MLYLQSILLSSSSVALIPLLSFLLSFLQSWHCLVMCGPLQAHKNRKLQNSFLQGRILSYTCGGAAFGWLGQGLRKSLMYQAVGAFAFVFLMIVTFALIGYWVLLHRTPQKHTSHCATPPQKTSVRVSFLQGMLMVFIPCPVLFQFFALATLTGSLIGGLLVGLAHGLASTPIFWWGHRLFKKVAHYKKLRALTYVVISLLLIFHLFYFTGKLIHSEEDVSQKFLFCF